MIAHCALWMFGVLEPHPNRALLLPSSDRSDPSIAHPTHTTMRVDLDSLKDADRIQARVHLSQVPPKEESETQDKLTDAMNLVSLALSIVSREVL